VDEENEGKRHWRSVCVCAQGERGNVFDIRSAHTAGEAGTAGHD